MQVMKVQGISAYGNANRSNNAKQNFNGHWETRQVGAPYPYEGTTARVKLYVADVDESFDSIRANFLSQAQGNRDIFHPFVGYNIYSIGCDNYFVDMSQNRENKKRLLTLSSEEKIKDKKWVDAVEDKLKIANILKEQGPRMERDKFLTEEGIRTIFSVADNDSKMGIMALVSEYNMDMAKAMAKTIKKLK